LTGRGDAGSRGVESLDTIACQVGGEGFVEEEAAQKLASEVRLLLKDLPRLVFWRTEEMLFGRSRKSGLNSVPGKWRGPAGGWSSSVNGVWVRVLRKELPRLVVSGRRKGSPCEKAVRTRR